MILVFIRNTLVFYPSMAGVMAGWMRRHIRPGRLLPQPSVFSAARVQVADAGGEESQASALVAECVPKFLFCIGIKQAVLVIRRPA
jgi:hypothetical protein